MRSQISKKFIASSLLFCIILTSAAPLNFTPKGNSQRLRTLYNSLDPLSIAQHLAFYELYSESPQGQEALAYAWKLLTKSQQESQEPQGQIPFTPTSLGAIVGLVNKQVKDEITPLSDEELKIVERLSKHLPNNRLKGHYVISEQQVFELEPHEIDLAHDLFLSQLGNDPDALRKVRSYEAMIDLMALQILARIPMNASPEIKVRAINNFVFEDMRFRFPPHSLYAKDIDLYTFLPSVLDSHRGVCLGVSILYICIAQRLALPLEMITPPGHIYVRYADENQVINIETTARGMNLSSDEYLGIDTRSLQKRNIKEVIGLAHFNQAAVYWRQDNYQKAIDSYLKAQPYIPDDKLLMELLAYQYLFIGQKDEGERLLKQVENHIPDYAVVKDTIAEDYLKGNVDASGIQSAFKFVDETRDSIISKRLELEKTLEKFPNFRAGWFHLAITWLQLHREKEGLEALKRAHLLSDNEPTAEYYLSVLYGERLDYNNAWKHLQKAEKITSARNHQPKALKELRRDLILASKSNPIQERQEQD